MIGMTRATAIRTMARAGGVLLLGLFAGGQSLRDALRLGRSTFRPEGARGAALTSTLKPIGMMGTRIDMSAYTELFDRHTEIKRRVEHVPGGVRTVTESDAPELVARLQAHVASMYDHLNRGAEVTCMSASLPTLFRHASSYQRRLVLTPKGVAVTETSSTPEITRAIRDHAREVTGFVREGMQAMMNGGAGSMMGGGARSLSSTVPRPEVLNWWTSV